MTQKESLMKFFNCIIALAAIVLIHASSCIPTKPTTESMHYNANIAMENAQKAHEIIDMLSSVKMRFPSDQVAREYRCTRLQEASGFAHDALNLARSVIAQAKNSTQPKHKTGEASRKAEQAFTLAEQTIETVKNLGLDQCPSPTNTSSLKEPGMQGYYQWKRD